MLKGVKVQLASRQVALETPQDRDGGGGSSSSNNNNKDEEEDERQTTTTMATIVWKDGFGASGCFCVNSGEQDARRELTRNLDGGASDVGFPSIQVIGGVRVEMDERQEKEEVFEVEVR